MASSMKWQAEMRREIEQLLLLKRPKKKKNFPFYCGHELSQALNDLCTKQGRKKNEVLEALLKLYIKIYGGPEVFK